MEKQKEPGRSFYRLAAILVGGILALAGVAYVVLYVSMAYLEHTVDELKRENTALIQEYSNAYEIPRSRLPALKAPVHEMEVRRAAQTATLGVLQFLKRELPPGLKLVAADVDGGALILRVVSPSREAMQPLEILAWNSVFLDQIRITPGAAREENGKRLTEFRLEAKIGQFPDKAAGAQQRKTGPPAQKGDARTTAKPKAGREDDADSTELNGSDIWLAAGMALACILLLLGARVLKRWWVRRNPPVSSRILDSALAQFTLLDARDASTWRRIPRFVVLAELVVIVLWLATTSLLYPVSGLLDVLDEEVALRSEQALLRDKQSKVRVQQQQDEQVVKHQLAQLACCKMPMESGALQERIRAAARHARLGIMVLDAVAPGERGGLVLTPLKLELQGSLPALMEFADILKDMPGEPVLERLRMEPVQPGQHVSSRQPMHFTLLLAAQGLRPDVAKAREEGK